MAAVAEAEVASPSLTAESGVVSLPHVAWETYERLLADDEERRVPRLTYDRGVLEAVSPSPEHEEDADTLRLIVMLVSAALGIPIRRLGATTFRRRDVQRGFEADGSFYIQHEPLVRGRRNFDLAVDPPPDLVVEIEVSRSAISKLPLYAAMGVPEVWRSDGAAVVIHLLAGDVYRTAGASAALPILTAERLTRLLRESRRLPSPDWARAVTEWAVAGETGSTPHD
jgi:Uma2 family endonuclease